MNIRLFLGDLLIEESLCDARGNYTFDNLESGLYHVEASLPGFETATAGARVRPGGHRRLTMRLGAIEKTPFDAGALSYWREADSEAREEVSKARQLRMTGDNDRALLHLRTALERDPSFSIAHGEMGLCYMRMDQLDEARASLQKAIELGPESLTPYLNLAEVLNRQRDFQGARDTLGRALEFHPERAEPDYILAKILFESGDAEGALQLAHRAMERDITYVPQIHLLLADLYEQRGELYRVPDELQAYLTKDPAGQDAESALARLESIRRKLKSMEISLKRYSELMVRYREGRFLDAATALARLPRDVTTRASRMYRKDLLTDGELLVAAMLHTDAALVSGNQRSFHFQNATEYLRAMEDEANRRSAERVWHLAVAYHFQSEQRFLVALPFLSQAARHNPEDPEVLMALGNTCEAAAWIYGYRNLIDRAELVYRKVVASDPDNVEVHLRLAHVLKLKGNKEESLTELSWTLANAENSDSLMVANLLLGDLHREAHNLPEAIQCYRKAFELGPNCQVAATALAYTLRLAGDSVGAHLVLKRWLERDNGEISENKGGWWRYLLGHSRRSDRMMTRLREGVLE